MSLATEQVPLVVLPAHFLPGRADHPPRTRALTVVPERTRVATCAPRGLTTAPAPPSPELAAVITLGGAEASTPTRLTRRGMLAASALTTVAAALLIALAWWSAPAAMAPVTPPARVTVQPGDTLWSIATSVAPDRDPRDEVATLQRLNRLDGVSLAVGQVLRTR